jgi:hypothetical protein
LLVFLTKNGAFIKYEDKNIGQGKEQVKELLAEDDKLKEKIKKEILNKNKEKTDAAKKPLVRNTDKKDKALGAE